MKKTLAVILSVIMLLGVMPFAGFAADASDYDRAKVAADDEAYIADMTAEQIASVILDWADREIAKYAEEMKDAVVNEVIAGFEGFELSAFGDEIAAQIPDITSLDDVIGYKAYLAELGGDFAALDATNLITREAAGSAIGFIDGVLQFMADNSETFGKVFRWDEEVFDYGKVGEYIESLDTTDADNKKIVDFYNDYLIGNDIQAKFINWIATQMNYTPAEGETFDDTLNNGILGWFVGLCEDNGILSAEAIAELEAYDLRTTDIYTLVENFVGLVQADNQVKIDTYYNYLMDTVVRTLLKTTLGQVAKAGEVAEVPASFAATYTDLTLLEEISGGTAYYKDGDAYYEITIADGAATAKTITWEDALDINFEAPTATIYTGADGTTKVAEYRPSSTNYLDPAKMPVYLYASAQNQTTINGAITGGDETKTGMTFAGTEVAAEYAALMTDANKKALDSRFVFEVTGADLDIPKIDLDFSAIEAYAEEMAVEAAAEVMANMGMGITVKSVDVTLSYTGWATEDEFIAQVAVDGISAVMENVPVVGTLTVKEDTVLELPVVGTINVGEMMTNAVNSVITNPLVTVVADELSGSLNIDDAKELLGFIDTDFAIDADLLDLAGNYDAYDGVVGQANHILYGLVDMLVSDSGMAELKLVDGDNTNFTANLEKICATANDMMAAANEVINNEEYKNLAGQLGIDVGAILAQFDTELLYKIDFSSVEALWVSVIKLGLDLVDDGTNELIAKIHTLVKDCADLDAMAIAVADYAIGECVTAINEGALGKEGLVLENVAATGSAKDVVMTKAVAIAYDAAVWGVDLLNGIANELIGHVEGETNIDLPTVAFELGVTESADWEVTLAALVNRVYELADGIIIACDNEYTDTFDKIAAVANSILPLGSLASNCASDNFAFDINLVMGYLFDDALSGNFDGFLGLFETEVKTEDVAADCSVTEALIVASEHIVDSIFPGTVVAADYVNATSEKFTEITVQEYFTSAENDAVIASNNMDSINARKADLVPAALNLVREAGILPFFAKCDQDHTAADLETVEEGYKAPTCTEAGKEATVKCAECGYVVSGGETIKALGHKLSTKTTDSTCTKTGTKVTTCSRCDYSKTETIPVKAHSYGAWKVTKAATCTEKGIETRTCSCGKTETRDIATVAHTDANEDNKCDVCGKEIDSSFVAKIKAFFQSIINWFKSLFGIK